MESAARVRYFLLSQHVADGFRKTLAILLPALVCGSMGILDEGINMSLGALVVSISDTPGPFKHRRNGMFYCLLIAGLIALLTGVANHSATGMGTMIVVSTFIFSMFSLYGNRMASMGTAALLIMILRMPDVKPLVPLIRDIAFIMGGGFWYLLISLAFYTLAPFRPIQRVLGDCLTETAKYLLIKASLYDLQADTQKAYIQLLNQQTIVNEKQNEVRELLFKTRSILRESTFEGRRLVVTFSAAVDLFEQIMASWYNYDELRKKYEHSPVLNQISEVITQIAAELSQMGESLHSHTPFTRQLDLIPVLNKIKKETETETGTALDFTLRKILINIRNLDESINRISRYFSKKKKEVANTYSEKDYSRFVAHQKISLSVFLNNLNLNSTVFRHSLRVMITCTVGYSVSKLISTGHHSYWILMTIIIIMKPAYSLTKAKNKDRLLGTIGGGLIGILILFLIRNDIVLFILLAFFMMGTYTFVRLNYVVMVIFLTPYVLILFHFFKLDIIDIAGERLLDTAIASLLAWLATRYLFPRWESETIKGYLIQILKANQKYLEKLRAIDLKEKLNLIEYKLVRKDVFVSTANISGALHRMQSEPESKQKHKIEIYELVVLNHVLSSNIASAADEALNSTQNTTVQAINQLDHAIGSLTKSIQAFEPAYAVPVLTEKAPFAENKNESNHVSEQYQFIRKIATDIQKLILKIAAT